jgi:hypothetical protein
MMNMSEAKGAVKARTLVIGGENIEIHFLAFVYPTETAAKNAWERGEAKHKRGDHFSLFRQLNPETGEWYVIALSEQPAQVRGVRRLIAPAGQPYEPDDEQLRQLVLRRIRVIGGKPGAVIQKARYGKSGAVIDDKGFLHPHKRPQG